MDSAARRPAGKARVAESILILRDISHRKEGEAALKASEARYQDLYHNAPDMFASVDRVSNRIVQCNLTFVSETGLARCYATHSRGWTRPETSGTSSFGSSVRREARSMSA